MFGRAFVILFFPQLLTVATLALSVVTFLTGYKNASALKPLHFMTLDLSDLEVDGIKLSSYEQYANISQIYTIGVNGFCYGYKSTETNGRNIVGCETPVEPYWFSVEQIFDNGPLNQTMSHIQIPSDVANYQNIAKNVTYGMWVCWIITICLSALQALFGIFALCTEFSVCCSSFISIVNVAASIMAAGLSSGLYRVYSDKINNVVGEFGVHASLDPSGNIIAWATVLCNFVAACCWCLTACCCASPRRKQEYQKTDTEPFIGYAPKAAF